MGRSDKRPAGRTVSLTFIGSDAGGYLDHVYKSLVVKCLSRLSRQHLAANCDQTCTFSFDLIGNTISAFGSYEREQLAATLTWMQEQRLVRGIALDIGANIGNHSLAFSRYFSE